MINLSNTNNRCWYLTQSIFWRVAAEAEKKDLILQRDLIHRFHQTLDALKEEVKK